MGKPRYRLSIYLSVYLKRIYLDRSNPVQIALQLGVDVEVQLRDVGAHPVAGLLVISRDEDPVLARKPEPGLFTLN